MAYTVKDVYNFVYPMIWQHWASRLIWPNNFIYLINLAINMVYNYEGYIRSFMHRLDLFNMNEKWQGALLSRWPVRKIDRFRTSWRRDVDKIVEDPCICDMNLPDKVIPPCCACECPLPCTPLDLAQIQPHNKLCPWTYQISGSFYAGMWGFDGRIVKVDVWNTTVNDLRMSYFCGPVKMEKFSDVVPLPDSFMHILAWIIAGTVVPLAWISRQQEDLNYYSLYRKELDYLRKADNMVPKEIVLDSPIVPTYTPAEPDWFPLWPNAFM